MLVSAITATFFARYAVKTNYFSEMLNDRTQGLDQVPEWVLSLFSMMGQWPWHWADTWSKAGSDMVFTPVWLPQLAMSVGTILLAVAIWDYLYRLLIFRETQIVREAVERLKSTPSLFFCLCSSYCWEARFGLDWLSWGLLGLEWSCLHPVQLGMQ